MMIEAFQIVVFLLCMVGSAFYAGIETGIISIHRMRLRHHVREGLPGAETLENFLKDSDRLLGTTLVGNNLTMVVVSVVLASLFAQLFESGGESIAAFVATVLVLIFGEYLPKAWFHSRPLERCRRFARLLRLSEIVFRPVSTAVLWITRWIVPGSTGSLTDSAPFVTREDLKVLAREGEEHGVLSQEERVMIHRVFELSGKRAREIMIPRDEITLVNRSDTLTSLFNTARTSGFTRLPVYDEDKKQFSGIVNVFDALSYRGDSTDRPLAWLARPPVFVHESTPVDDILPIMRRYKQPMCLVTGARENVCGLITTEDILEEIVGTT
jgi:putative hemolysin